MNSSDPCFSTADDVLGPQVIGCRDGFDFTLLFEQSILSLSPSVLLLGFSLSRLFQLSRSRVKTRPSPLRIYKPLALLCAACLRLCLLVLWITDPARQSRISVAAAALSLVAILVAAVLSHVEHARSVRPSFIINSYLFLSTILDSAQARTLWLLPGNKNIAAVFTACLIFNIALLTLESVEKRPFLKLPYSDYPPEALGGIFNRGVFWWLNGLFRHGYRQVLGIDDLFETDHKLSSQNLQHRMLPVWLETDKTRKHALLRTTLSCFKLQFGKMVIPRLFVSTLKFCQPLLINRAVTLMSEPYDETNRKVGYAMIGATALTYFGLGIGNAAYKHTIIRAVTMIRGGLITLISDVTLRLGARSVKESAAVTLMSTDVDRVVTGLEYLDFIWASPVEIGAALYLLYVQIGLACLIPLAISLCSAVAGFFIGNAAAEAQKRWAAAVQKRVGVTASTLSSMKAVRMTGLSTHLGAEITSLKQQELRESNRFRRITTARNAISNFSLFMSPALTFAVYFGIHPVSSSSGAFTPATAFTSLSIIALLSQSIQWWVIALFTLQASLGCYERIQEYLASETRKDMRQCGSALMPVPPNRRDEITELLGPSGAKQDPSFLKGKMLDQPVISIVNGGFGFSIEGPLSTIINNIDLTLKSSTLTMIIGPVGSGKSTLLQSLLGETHLTSGTIHVATPEIAYCAQEPWLPNVCIRQVVIGTSHLDESWYSRVIQACNLTVDIGQLPNGHDTLVGSKGVALSGGQRQRLAIARAIYARKSILLLDDVLSGLDGRTEQAVFHSVLGPEGICRNQEITVVFATHAVQYTRFADHIVVLSQEGSIAKQGPYNEVEPQRIHVSNPSDHPDGKDLYVASSKETASASQRDASQVDSTSKTRLSSDLEIYVYYARAVGWVLIVYLCAQISTTFFIKFPDVWLNWWSASEEAHHSERTNFYLGIYCMFAGLALFSMITAVMTLFTKVMPTSSTRLHRRLLDAVMNATYSFMSATDSGVILNRFSQDMSLIDMQLPTALLQTADGFLICLAQSILIATFSKFVAALIPAALLVLYFLQRFYLRTSRQLRLLDLEAKSPLYTHFLETLSGLPTIRAFNWQKEWNQHGLKLLDRSQRPVYLLYCIQRWLGLVLDSMVAVFAVAIITLATQLDHNAVSSGLGVALVNLLTLSNMLSYLIRAWTDMDTSVGAVQRIRDFTSLTPSEAPRPEDPSQNQPPAGWPQQGAVEFRDVNVAYTGSAHFLVHDDANSLFTPVLKDINLSFPAGCHVGICGRTGSGKSTLLESLFRLPALIGGTISIDGLNTANLDRATLRSALLAVPQSGPAFLLPGTLRTNIDPSGTLSEATIIAALERVGLWEVIRDAGGLDKDADDTSLSYGERALFGLARALCARGQRLAGVLVLDELSASVDAETEEHMARVVREEFRGWTVISVAHRLETIRDCDLIVVMGRGKVVEVGRPKELERLDGGVWRDMIGRAEGRRDGRVSKSFDVSEDHEIGRGKY